MCEKHKQYADPNRKVLHTADGAWFYHNPKQKCQGYKCDNVFDNATTYHPDICSSCFNKEMRLEEKNNRY